MDGRRRQGPVGKDSNESTCLLAFGDVELGHQPNALPARHELDHRTVIVDVDSAGHGELYRFAIQALPPLEVKDLGAPASSVQHEWMRFEIAHVVAVDLLVDGRGELEV